MVNYSPVVALYCPDEDGHLKVIYVGSSDSHIPRNSVTRFWDKKMAFEEFERFDYSNTSAANPKDLVFKLGRKE